ncbi:hypothetical protein PXNS11_250023 [Stutzerimonas xanthomarina]|nr:hypothetical protein PXNS11_250023 [Stutzerimonas xanthomarina]
MRITGFIDSACDKSAVQLKGGITAGVSEAHCTLNTNPSHFTSHRNRSFPLLHSKRSGNLASPSCSNLKYRHHSHDFTKEQADVYRIHFQHQ